MSKYWRSFQRALIITPTAAGYEGADSSDSEDVESTPFVGFNTPETIGTGTPAVLVRTTDGSKLWVRGLTARVFMEVYSPEKHATQIGITGSMCSDAEDPIARELEITRALDAHSDEYVVDCASLNPDEHVAAYDPHTLFFRHNCVGHRGTTAMYICRVKLIAYVEEDVEEFIRFSGSVAD